MCFNLLPFSSKSIFKVIVYLTLFSSNEHRLFEIFSGNIGITVSLRYVELPLKSASLSILLPISKNEETSAIAIHISQKTLFFLVVLRNFTYIASSRSFAFIGSIVTKAIFVRFIS